MHEGQKLHAILQELQDTKQSLGVVLAREEVLCTQLTQATDRNEQLKAELSSANNALEEAKQESEALKHR